MSSDHALTRADLDAHRPATQGERGLRIAARCHPTAQVWCWYFRGVLTFACARCERVISRVKVATA